MNVLEFFAMDQAFFPSLLAERENDTPGPRPRVAPDWPLMADILTHRMEVPEHLIRWRKAQESDHDELPST